VNEFTANLELLSSQHERGTPQTMKIRRDPLRLCGSA
jgi:hypothetical protein